MDYFFKVIKWSKIDFGDGYLPVNTVEVIELYTLNKLYIMWMSQ